MPIYCCDNLDKAVKERLIAHDGKGWHVNGCCGQCFILSDIKHCPFCSAGLPARTRATPGAGKTLNGKKQKDKLKNQPSLINI